MPKKPLTFAERLQKTIDAHNKRTREELELFRREQVRQGKKPDEPIDIMGLLK